MMQAPVKRNILDLGISDVTYESVLEYVYSLLSSTSKKAYIVTPNPEIAVYASKHPSFKKVINEADLAVCDGTGLLVASYILNRPLSARVTGVDLMAELCSMAQDKGLSIGLLGGRGSVAERTAQCLRIAYSNLTISFIGEEWSPAGFANAKRIAINDERLAKSKKIVNRQSSIVNHIDILFVAFGFPKQEQWISENLPKIPVRVAMGVGGAFDYISGSVTRAPMHLRFLGFEWLYRLMKEPWRWRRQIALFEFIWLLLKARFSPRS